MQQKTDWLLEKKLQECPIHKGSHLEWICLEKTCEKRILCQFCVIGDHKNVHQNFSHITQVMKDPLVAIQKLDVVDTELEALKPGKNLSYKTRVHDAVRKEEDKLDQLLSMIVLNLNSKFEQIRKTFHDDVEAFLKAKDKELEYVENNRKDYIEFIENYFPGVDFQSIEQLKEGVNIIISKYFADEDLHKNLKETKEAIPLVKCTEKYQLSLNNRLLPELKWRVFFDKEIYLDGAPKYRYNSAKTCGDIEFSNDDSTVKKKGGNSSSTVLGEKNMDLGVFEWEVEINEMGGSYICIGAINSKNNWNLKGDNYGSAMCVCSDGCAYGLNKDEGNITMAKGDVINFRLDMDVGEFIATGPNKKYIYKQTGLKGNEYVAFLGFASSSTFKLTIR